jgi:uncharacterized protein YqeY
MIKEDISKAIISAMKAGNKTEVKVLRFIMSQIKYEEIAKQKELTGEEQVLLIQKEVKRRKEAIEMFKKGGREDIVADEETQVKILNKYLPEQLTEEELTLVIEEIITQYTGEINFGKVIAQVMQKTKGRTDGALVAGLVKKRLNIIK